MKVLVMAEGANDAFILVPLFRRILRSFGRARGLVSSSKGSTVTLRR